MNIHQDALIVSVQLSSSLGDASTVLKILGEDMWERGDGVGRLRGRITQGYIEDDVGNPFRS